MSRVRGSGSGESAEPLLPVRRSEGSSIVLVLLRQGSEDIQDVLREGLFIGSEYGYLHDLVVAVRRAAVLIDLDGRIGLDELQYQHAFVGQQVDDSTGLAQVGAVPTEERTKALQVLPVSLGVHSILAVLVPFEREGRSVDISVSAEIPAV